MFMSVWPRFLAHPVFKRYHIVFTYKMAAKIKWRHCQPMYRVRVGREGEETRKVAGAEKEGKGRKEGRKEAKVK